MSSTIANQIVLEALFSQFCWPELNKAHLTHGDIAPILEQLSSFSDIKMKKIGESFEARPIYQLSVGHGPKTVLAWTQMHGDEPTATAAVLDWLHCLANTTPPGWPSDWKDAITLHVIPMLNPDGAERCTRENAQSIDINRDAKALATQEGFTLYDTVHQLQPDLAFNLHDQNDYYGAGKTPNPATLSFLAPAFNASKEIDKARTLAMKLVATMAKRLTPWLGSGIGRYDDTYCPRSFGDYIASTGASTILIESGAAKQDPQRQVARKCNVFALCEAVSVWLSPTGPDTSIEDYFAILPNRDNGLYDLLLRNISVEPPGRRKFKCDIGLKKDAKAQLIIEDIGDLSVYFGFEEIFECGLVWQRTSKTINAPLTLNDDTYLEYLKDGYCCFRGDRSKLDIATSMPVLWLENHDPEAISPQKAMPAYFTILRNGAPYFVCLDGQVYFLK